MSEEIPCPFVYSNGKSCKGFVRQARAYGLKSAGGVVERENVRCYRLWCSDRDDHAGAISDSISKMRMEFRPSELADGVEDQLWNEGLVE